MPGGLFGQSDVRETPATSTVLAPVGSVVAWLKSFTNTPSLPAGWVECDGSAIVGGLMNGQNTPDLNGGIFLEGQATSGATGGSATMAHTHVSITDQDLIEHVTGDAWGFTSEQPNTSGASNAENRPPFHTVVWIMRTI